MKGTVRISMDQYHIIIIITMTIIIMTFITAHAAPRYRLLLLTGDGWEGEGARHAPCCCTLICTHAGPFISVEAVGVWGAGSAQNPLENDQH